MNQNLERKQSTWFGTIAIVPLCIALFLICSGCALNTSDRLTANLRIKNSTSTQITNVKQISLIMKRTWGDLLQYSNDYPDLLPQITSSYQEILAGYNRHENVSNSSYIKELRIVYEISVSPQNRLVFDDGLEYTTGIWGYPLDKDEAKIRIQPGSYYTIEITDSSVTILKD